MIGDLVDEREAEGLPVLRNSRLCLMVGPSLSDGSRRLPDTHSTCEGLGLGQGQQVPSGEAAHQEGQGTTDK